MAVAKQNKIKLAETLTLESDMTQSEICTVVGITDKTYRSWSKKYGWEALREASNVTVGRIVSSFYSKIYNVMQEDAEKKEKLLDILKQLKNDLPDYSDELATLYDGMEKMELPSGDSIAKYTSALKVIKGSELGLSDYIRMFKEFTNWTFQQGDLKRMIMIEGNEVVLNGVDAGKLLNLWMQEFISAKIHGGK